MLIASPNVTAAVAAAELAAAASAASAASAAASATLASTYASDADPTETYPSKASVEVATIAAATQFVRTAGYTTPGDYGGALYVRVASQPTHAGKIRSTDRFLPNGTTSNDNGGWWAIRETILTPQMFGAKGDSTGITGNGTDDYQAIVDAISTVSVGTTDWSWSVAGPTVWFPPADYRVGSTIELKKQVKLMGQLGSPADTQPRLIFDADTTGIVINAHNTINGGGNESPSTGTAIGMVIEGLFLKGAGTDESKHGIWMRTRSMISRCFVHGFPGNGIHIWATSTAGGAAEGNANLWRVSDAATYNNGLNGMWVEGADVNAGLAIAVDAVGNQKWGIHDSSFLGNTYIGCHASDNGLDGAIVTYEGNHYFARPTATEAQYVATTPGTNENVWVLGGAGGMLYAKAWTAAQPEGTYRSGGPYYMDYAWTPVIGCYSEGGQAPSMFAGQAIAMGGLHGGGVGYGTTVLQGSNGNINFNPLIVDGLYQRASDARPADGTGLTGEISWNTGTVGNTKFSFAGWRCLLGGGGWVPFGRTPYSTNPGGDGDSTLNAHTFPTFYDMFIELGADRTITLDTTSDADAGVDGFLRRTASGEFAMKIGAGTPLTTLAQNEWCQVALAADRTTWKLGAKGSLDYGGQQTINTDVDITLREGVSRVDTRHTGTLTADRAVALSTTNATKGKKFRITRTGGGAFNLNIGTGPLKALATNTWCEVVYDGSAWYLAAYGAL